MTLSIITEIEALFDKLKASTPVQTIEADAKAIASSTINYVKTNGLQDVYELALDALPALIGQPWGAVLAKIEADAVAAGKTLISGASAIIASQAQADLLAAGKLLAPVTAPAAPTA